MRKIICFMMVSPEGYFEGPNHDLSWHNVDKEFNVFALNQMKETDLILFGRKMYKTMETFWPQAEDNLKMSKENIEIAHRMNTTKKIVFSKTLKGVRKHKNWKNVTIVRKFEPKEIRKLKAHRGKTIWVGGPNLAVNFIKENLIDEFRLVINPVFVGEGTTLFKGLGKRVKLNLVKTRRFKSGNVLLCYRPIKT